MKRDQRGAKRHKRPVRVWTLAQARAALPYLSSVLRSLREHRLEALGRRRDAKQLAQRPGRPTRATLTAHADAVRDADEAEARAGHALDELRALDVRATDPVAGVAHIPFVRGDELAWFVFDLFDADPIQSWRFHADPPETRRPLDELDEESPESTWFA